MTRYEYLLVSPSTEMATAYAEDGWRVIGCPVQGGGMQFLLEREVPQDTPQVQGQLEGPVDVPTPTPSRLEVSQDAVLAVLRDHWPMPRPDRCTCGAAFTASSALRVHVADRVAAALTRPHDQARP